MDEEADMLTLLRQAARKKMLFLPHAVRQMARPERMISSMEVREAIEHGTVIEDYPGDPRGHSCLVLGYGDLGRAMHVVCAPKEDYLAIITAYLPDKNEWTEDLRARRRP